MSAKYCIRNSRVTVPVGREQLYVSFAYYTLYKVTNTTEHISSLSLPCRSNLYRFLTRLLYHNDSYFQGDIEIPEDKVKYLTVIFDNQRDYKFWKEGLKVLQNTPEKGWEWVETKVPLIQLRSKLSGE